MSTEHEIGDKMLKINAKMAPSRILRIMQRSHSAHAHTYKSTHKIHKIHS